MGQDLRADYRPCGPARFDGARQSDVCGIIEPENEEDLSGVANAIGDDFDFDRLIAIPEELRSTSADRHYEYQVYYEASPDLDDLERRRAELDQDPKNRAKADLDKTLLERYGAYDWYDWCCTNWGTKWSARDVSIEADDYRITILFDTAWGFPGPIFERLSEMFPSLHFRGHAAEPNMGWALVFHAHGGRLRIARLDYAQCLDDDEETQVAVS